MVQDYLPILLQTTIVTGFAVSTLLVSVILGKSARRNAMKDSPYECGMLPIGEAQPRFSVKFYLVAMLFVIFDIEVVFLYPWAVTFKKVILSEGFMGAFWGMAGFVLILLVAYLYAMAKGALNWNEEPEQIAASKEAPKAEPVAA